MPHPADEHLDANHPALILIERHALFRTCILKLLRNELTELDIIEMASVDQATSARRRTVRLVALSTGDKVLTDPNVQRDITLLKVTFPDVPIVILSERYDAATITAAIHCGASLLPTSVSIEIAIAGLRLLLTDSVYFLQQRGQGLTGQPNGHAILSMPAKLCYSGESDGSPPKGGRNGPMNGDMGSSEMGGDITPREEQVLAKLLIGMPNKIIATQLHLSENTVKMHIQHICRKLRARNRTEAAFLWHKRRSGPSKDSPLPD